MTKRHSPSAPPEGSPAMVVQRLLAMAEFFRTSLKNTDGAAEAMRQEEALRKRLAELEAEAAAVAAAA